MNVIVLLLFTIAPDDCVKEYLIAVNGNAMGWFCARWNTGNREFEADSQMDLYRKVAGDVLANRVYDLRPWSDMKTVIIKDEAGEVWAWCRNKFPKIPADEVFKRVGEQEYEWLISPTSQGIIPSLLKAFPGKVKIGKRHDQ